MPRTIVDAADLPGLVGAQIGVSDWLAVDQPRIDAFADVTDDHQFIHVDPKAAAQTPFGGTIAHGMLTLSLLPRMSADATLELKGVVMGVNYGFNRVRFLQPVPAGARVRGRFTLIEARNRRKGRWVLTYDAAVEIDGHATAALKAEWLTMQIVPA